MVWLREINVKRTRMMMMGSRWILLVLLGGRGYGYG